MIALVPKTPPTPERVRDARAEFDRLTASLSDVVAGIEASLAVVASVPAAPCAEERETRIALNRLSDALHQAQRELGDGRPRDALSTLQTVRARLLGLRHTLLAWMRAEPDEVAAALLTEWLDALDNRLEVAS